MNTVESPSGAKKPGGFALWAARLQMAHGRKLVLPRWRGRSLPTPS